MTKEEREQFERLRQQVEAQVAQIQALAARLAATESLQTIPEPPAWAAAAVQAAVEAKLIDTPLGGSYDFYRLLTVLHRKKDRLIVCSTDSDSNSAIVFHPRNGF
ncbi:hypothetical protein OMP40_34110 [Cohnella rhizosphaerae]|uniref:Uncharacterized protein n=1 Tax=Cohnella rhizosphaerae TaxID=1457232 RepID=A0A9X4QWE3_9BACL|nr:hypothetical protein [Cohnella rhizosphaerae]